MVEISRYAFDGNGNAVKLEMFNAKGKLQSKILLTLDDRKNVLQEKIYDAINRTEKTTVFTYQYDNFGNWTLKTSMVEGKTEGVLTERTFSYFP